MTEGDERDDGKTRETVAFRRAVRAGYDSLADAYAARRDAGNDDPGLLAGFLADLEPGARVLDVGCGAGELVLEELAADATGVGLDLSREQAKRAREHADSVAQGDMTHLPFADDTFDAATAIYSVIHVPASEHATVYAELARVLRPGGEAVLVTGHEAWTGANPDWLDAGTEMQWSWPDLADTERALRDAGFRIVAADDVRDSLGGSFRHLHVALA